MRTRGTFGASVAVVIVLASCGSDSAGEFELEPADTEPVRASSISVGPTDMSITDVLTTGVLDGPGPAGRTLAGLLLPPAAIGEFRIAAAIVDDPNGTGGIDGRWYPPRIKRGNCSTSIDAPPIPTAAATYVPGDPATVYDGQSATDVRDLVGVDEVVGVTIQVFDDASQRDALFDVMVEQYRSSFQTNCDLGGSGNGSAVELNEVVTVEPFESLSGSWVFDVRQIGFAGLTALVPVGDRVMLTASAGDGLGGGGGATPDRDDLESVVVAQVDRIEAATLP